jgi:hypothetical protein
MMGSQSAETGRKPVPDSAIGADAKFRHHSHAELKKASDARRR